MSPSFESENDLQIRAMLMRVDEREAAFTQVVLKSRMQIYAKRMRNLRAFRRRHWRPLTKRRVELVARLIALRLVALKYGPKDVLPAPEKQPLFGIPESIGCPLSWEALRDQWRAAFGLGEKIARERIEKIRDREALAADRRGETDIAVCAVCGSDAQWLTEDRAADRCSRIRLGGHVLCAETTGANGEKLLAVCSNADCVGNVTVPWSKHEGETQRLRSVHHD